MLCIFTWSIKIIPKIIEKELRRESESFGILAYNTRSQTCGWN